MREAEIVELAIRRVGMALEKDANLEHPNRDIGRGLIRVADEIASLCRVHKEEKK
jgi:hypothetical protein